MFLHLPLFVLSPLEQFDILNLEIVSYIPFIVILLFLSYFFNRIRVILNGNFMFIAFNDSTWSYNNTTITPDVFLFRKHMFKCLENENFSHLQTNCSQDPQIWEVAYHIWSTQNLDQLTLWLALNNISSTPTPYVGFWAILFGGISILAVLSIGTFCILPELFILAKLEYLTVPMVSLAEHNQIVGRSEELWFAIDFEEVMVPQRLAQEKITSNFITVDDLSSTTTTSMVTLEDHNYQVGRCENRWFSIDIEEYHQLVYDQIMIQRHVESMERQRVMKEGQLICEQNVAQLIQIMHQQDADIQQVLLARLPTVHAEIRHDPNYFISMYHDNFGRFRNFNISQISYIKKTAHTYDSMRLNLQRISLGQYNRVSHSFMQQLVASEAQRYNYRVPTVHSAFSESFYNDCYNRYIADVQNLEKRSFLATPVPDPFIHRHIGGGH